MVWLSVFGGRGRIVLMIHSECFGNPVSYHKNLKKCLIAGSVFYSLRTLVDDSVFLGYPGDVGIRGDAEVAG